MFEDYTGKKDWKMNDTVKPVDYNRIEDIIIRITKYLDDFNLSDYPELKRKVADNTRRIDLIWDALFSNITKNPFVISFDDISDLTVAGIWNKEMTRIEC